MSNSEQGRWFVVHTLSGQEFKVHRTIDALKASEGVEDCIFEVQVPTEKVSDTRQGRKTVINRKFFPGYILVRMDLYDVEGSLNHKAWYFLKNIQGIIGFVGGDKPAPLTPEEVEDIMAQTRTDEEAPKPKIEYEVGEAVNIKDGPFANFEGIIESIDPERGKLKLSVSIFGRSTPIEVEYWQVERNV